MTTAFIPTPLRLAVLTLAATLAACTSTGNLLSGVKVDYRSAANRTKGLEVPPDLTQLARDGRYQPPAPVVSANSAAAATAAGANRTATGPSVIAPAAVDKMQIVRDGQFRWLSVPMAPEALWPQLRSFWVERGFAIASEDARAGVMETDWAENRAKLPQDGLRALLGRVLENLYDTGERDRFRTRIEQTATGSDIYVSHQGLQEVLLNKNDERTTWTHRPSDPQLEAVFLARLMVRLGSTEEAALVAVSSPEVKPARARALPVAEAAAIEIDDEFDRAWRRVGLALDRTGFTVEDRNRSEGVFFVRYVDSKLKPESKNFFGRIFSSSDEGGTAVKFRIAVKASGNGKSILAVQNPAGTPDNSDAAKQIAKVLLAELR